MILYILFSTFSLVLAGQLQFSNFSDGSLAPFSSCNVKGPSSVAANNGVLDVFFDEKHYDGTRDDRGAELCVFRPGTRRNVGQMAKEGWQGFSVFVPSTSASTPFPDDRETMIAQQFCPGRCSSWCGGLRITNNSLVAEHRPSCGRAESGVLAQNLTRDKWHDVIIRMRVSREQDGAYEVWLNGVKVYSKIGINVGFGTWDDDKLTTRWYFKNGMYAYDYDQYTGLTRTLHFANIAWYEADDGETDGYEVVKPTGQKGTNHVCRP